MNADMLVSFIWDVSVSFQKDLCQIYNKFTTMFVTNGYGFSYHSRAHELLSL